MSTILYSLIKFSKRQKNQHGLPLMSQRDARGFHQYHLENVFDCANKFFSHLNSPVTYYHMLCQRFLQFFTRFLKHVTINEHVTPWRFFAIPRPTKIALTCSIFEIQGSSIGSSLLFVCSNDSKFNFLNLAKDRKFQYNK